MTKLNQIIAVEKDVKSKAYSSFTKAHHTIQKTPLLNGISRTYQPNDDDGEQFPPESTKVQTTTEDVIKEVTTTLIRLFDVIATKDVANSTAKANVVVDGKILLENVPATYLLFLEKQLNDLHTFVQKLPILDGAESWTYDSNAGYWVTEPVFTAKSKKIPRNHVKAEATDRHPAQVEIWYEDVQVGKWKTVRFSGALPADRVKELLNRVETLQRAVTFAREEANNMQITDVKVGDKFFNYLFA